MRNASRNEEVPVFWKPTPTIKGEEARAMPAKVAFGLTSEGHPPGDVNDLRTQVEAHVDENAEFTAMLNPYAMKRFCSLWASALLMAGAWAQTSVVTFNLNMENENVSSSGVFLGGGVMGDATLTVRDIQGRLVASTAMRPSQQHAVLFAAAWEAGVYTVQIATEGARATWSFVK